MARGDVTMFEESLAYMIDGDWGSTDDIKCGVVTNAVVPTAADAAPDFADYTEVTAAGTYVAGGTSLGNLTTCVSEAGGTMTFDSATNPTWAQDASNGTTAYYGIIYNETNANDLCIAFVDLGGPVDMSGGDLTITWGASGIFTIS
jgi:hypothetical protein